MTTKAREPEVRDAVGTGSFDMQAWLSAWPDSTTLGTVRAHLRKEWSEGTLCPGCRQLVKLYRRKLNSAMALGLVQVYRYFRANPEAKWLHVHHYLMKLGQTDRECGYLRFWGLLEEMPLGHEDAQDVKGRTAGYWRITAKGRQFVEDKLTVPKYVWLFNQKPYPSPVGFREMAEEVVNIQEALGDGFDYKELMATEDSHK